MPGSRTGRHRKATKHVARLGEIPMAIEWWETVSTEWSGSSRADLEGDVQTLARRFGIQDDEDDDWNDDDWEEDEEIDEDLDEDWDDDDWDDDDLDEEIDEEPEPEEEEEEWG